MAKIELPRDKMDNSAFPVRVKVWLPEAWNRDDYWRLEDWLYTNLDHGNYAKHPAMTMGQRSSAYFFRDADAARGFLAAFPELELADGTILPGFIEPHFGWARALRREELAASEKPR